MPKAYASTVVNVPADVLWPYVRDFNNLPQWVPAIAASRIESDKAADQVGCVRHLTLGGDGGEIRERLVALSDADRFYRYVFEEQSVFPATNYDCTLKVTPVSDSGVSLVEWGSSFDCAPDKAGELIETFSNGVYKAGLDSLKAKHGG